MYAQMVWEIRACLARRPGDDARVLGVRTTQETDLALEDSEMPCTKSATQVGPQGCQSPHHQGG